MRLRRIIQRVMIPLRLHYRLYSITWRSILGVTSRHIILDTYIASHVASHLSWLIIDHFHAVYDFSHKLGETLMSRVFVHIVVPVFCAFELDHEAMCVRVLRGY